MKGKKNWRLGKTLSRQIEVRPIEDDDVKYAWAAYRKGALEAMGFAPDLNAQTFTDAFESYVLTNARAAWTVMAQTKDGFIPIGFVLGDWAPQGAFMMIVGISWFPWATRRNIVEGTVAFFSRVRKEMNLMGFASREHMPLYDVCCAHAVMRRVGTSHMNGRWTAVYEGR
jgi:hypothetical protein